MQRSIKHLKDQGYSVARGEHWNYFAKKKQDLFQFGDLLVANGDHIALVQVTTTGNMGAREKKIFSLPVHKIWLAAGGRIFVHGWSRKGPRGKRKVWCITEREVVADEPCECNGCGCPLIVAGDGMWTSHLDNCPHKDKEQI